MQNLTKDQIKSFIAILQEELEAQSIDEFQNKVDDRATDILNKKLNKLRRIEKVNAIFMVALEEQLNTELAEFIVYECLNKGRIANNYGTVRKAYIKIGDDIHNRRMMYVVSALYRLQFTTDKSMISQLNSTIKYNTACDHCGAIATKIKKYLDKNLAE